MNKQLINPEKLVKDDKEKKTKPSPKKLLTADNTNGNFFKQKFHCQYQAVVNKGFEKYQNLKRVK